MEEQVLKLNLEVFNLVSTFYQKNPNLSLKSADIYEYRPQTHGVNFEMGRKFIKLEFEEK